MKEVKVLRFEVRGQYIMRIDEEVPVAKCANMFKAHFDFLTEEWEGQKTAIFVQGNYSKSQLLDEHNECIVPWEFFDTEERTRGYVSVYCGDLITANESSVKIEKTGYRESDASVPPTPDVYQQILGEMDKKIDKSGHIPNKYLGTDDEGNVVEKEGPTDGGSGTTDYNDLENKPRINGNELSGDKTLEELGIQQKGEYALKEEIPTSLPASDVYDWAKQPQKPTYTATEVGAESKGSVNTHDVSDTAHSDIRSSISGLTEKLNSLANSDDETLDQMSEIVAYIKNNKTLIDGITTGKISTSEIVNNLVTNVTTKVLSAAQGVELKRQIDEVVKSIPKKLPNPHKLTFEGAVTAEYDGSSEITVMIPDTNGKLDKNQGAEHAGKALVIGEDGNVIPGEVQTSGGDGIAIVNTMSGESPLVIPDSAERQIKDLKLSGKSEQTQTTGKNLWNDKSFVRGHINETGEIVEDDSETEINGIWKIEAPQDGVYKIRCEKDSINGIYIKALLSGTEFSKPFLRLSKNVTLSITLKKGINYISGCGYTDANSETFRITGNEKIMISLGQSDPPPYEPYTGGRPSPSPEYPQEIRSVGKYNELTGKYEVLVNINNSGYLQKGLYFYNIRAFPLKKGKTYRIYVGLKSRTVNAFILNEERTFKNAGELYAYCNSGGLTSENDTGVVSGECKIPQLLYNGYTFHVTVDGLFLYQGVNSTNLDTDNAYITYDDIKNVNLDVLYKEQTLTLTSDRPVTKWDKLIEQDGQIGWLFQSARKTFENDVFRLYSDNEKAIQYKITNGENGDSWSESICYCNTFENVPGTTLYTQSGKTDFYMGCLHDTMVFSSKNKEGVFRSIETFQEWIRNSNTYVWYKTKNTEFVPLSQSEQDAIRALKTYYPTTVIAVDGGEVYGGAEVTYIADTKNYIDNKVAANVANIISQYQTNISNLLSLMPMETQATMIENDTNNILESEVTQWQTH
ncbi:hypothetical protein LIR45_01215 [Lachnospiraceae bacterium EP-SM-12S-S03]|nr:hypothetical protein [Lachnospiraceae bacterium EP-SM-12S-S03]